MSQSGVIARLKSYTHVEQLRPEVSSVGYSGAVPETVPSAYEWRDWKFVRDSCGDSVKQILRELVRSVDGRVSHRS